jgi:hypothetical protein
MTRPERATVALLVNAGLSWGIALRYVQWRRRNPGRHLGEAGSRFIASLVRGTRT